MSEYTDIEKGEEGHVCAPPSYPLTKQDLMAWVILGAAHSLGAIANTLGNVANEFFTAGRYHRELEDFRNMIENTREDINLLGSTEDPQDG